MKFEELETLWTAQPSIVPLVVDMAKIQRSLQPELRRRSRMLGYEVAVSLFCLIAISVFTLANYHHDPVRYGGAQLALAACQTAAVALLLAHGLRRLRRHQAIRSQPVDTLRAATAVSLANIEAEMRDYRLSQPVLWLAVASGIAAIVNAGVRHGWSTVAGAGLPTLALLGVVATVIWRHYIVNLRPAWLRQKEILRDLA